MFQSIDIALFCFCRHFHGLCLTSFLSMSTCMPMYELSLSGKKDQKTTTQPFRLEKPSLMSGIPRTPAKLLNMLQHLSNLAPFAWPRLHPVSPLTYQGQQPKGQDKPRQMWRQRLQRWNLSSFPRNTDLTVKLMLCFVIADYVEQSSCFTFQVSCTQAKYHKAEEFCAAHASPTPSLTLCRAVLTLAITAWKLTSEIDSAWNGLKSDK